MTSSFFDVLCILRISNISFKYGKKNYKHIIILLILFIFIWIRNQTEHKWKIDFACESEMGHTKMWLIIMGLVLGWYRPTLFLVLNPKILPYSPTYLLNWPMSTLSLQNNPYILSSETLITIPLRPQCFIVALFQGVSSDRRKWWVTTNSF